MNRNWSLVLIVIALLALAVTPALAGGPTNRAERAEVRFLEGMIDHHQMALDMAEDCLIKAASEPVRTLCQNVIAAQSAEIATMRGWLLVWYGVDYRPMPMAHMLDGMAQGGMQHGGVLAQGGMHHGSSGSTVATPVPGPHAGHGMGAPAGPLVYSDPPMMMGMMAGLSALTGAAYEIAWLEAMIDHHDDALHMSERILGVTQRPELQALAQGIIDAQTAEIGQMEQMIGDLGGEAR